MQAKRTLQGGNRERASLPRWQQRMARVAALAGLGLIGIVAIGGCAQAEKVRYVRHLTTVIEPSAELPEEAIFTFDIDRKRVQGAVAFHTVE